MAKAKNSLATRVDDALKLPIHKTLTIFGAKKFISQYQEDESHSKVLLKLAKTEFNKNQKMHQQELSEITRWWKELDFRKKLPFARDRVVECYFWVLGIYFEPQYRFARRTLSKVIAMASTIDDIYDVYGTLDELQLFTDAIQRWDVSALDQIPQYMRYCYQALLDVYAEAENELDKTGKSYCVNYAKEEMKKLVRAYYEEAKWLYNNHIPTMDEYVHESSNSIFWLYDGSNNFLSWIRGTYIYIYDQYLFSGKFVKLRFLFSVNNVNCPICDLEEESIDHLFLRCPFAKSVWFNSKWCFRIDSFSHEPISGLLNTLLDPKSRLFPSEVVRLEFLIFAALAMESIWNFRNCICHDKPIVEQNKFISLLEKKAYGHFAAQMKVHALSKAPHLIAAWYPPKEGLLKVNTDASFKDGIAAVAVIVRNSRGTILFASATNQPCLSPFVAEVLSLHIASTLLNKWKILDVCIENDCLQAIFELNNPWKIPDWFSRSDYLFFSFLQFEQKKSAVHCYMNQNNNSSKEETFDELEKQVSRAWKDINQECLDPMVVVSMPILMRIVNSALVMYLLYKDEDGYTNSNNSKIKDIIKSVLIEPVTL
ncbi:hypothetical protein RD792_006977 [Penstemon davidsonii]|uniref:Uncharacterized protein n=1 Tax=Penstemon davidsonii TaxID=160366 RepID=A0ABR0D543_9LAMI|nr:hypothetical protein RD792_006977 [Penstemon davidsonii]